MTYFLPFHLSVTGMVKISVNQYSCAVESRNCQSNLHQFYMDGMGLEVLYIAIYTHALSPAPVHKLL